MAGDTYTANGIDAERGGYLLPPLPAAEIAAAALGARPDDGLARELADRRRAGRRSYRVNADTRNLAETGWGVVFARDTPPAVREALAPLLAHRRAQAGERFRQLVHYPGDSKSAFLLDAGVGPGPVVPDKVPYYLLLVGDPAAIPYRFQYELDVQYAVGRVHFDTPDEYAAYARSVVAAETGALLRPPRAAFFGPSHPDDPATLASAANLVAPLAAAARAMLDEGRVALAAGHTWAADDVRGGAATKSRLAELVGGRDAPALLFAACHGLGFPHGSPRQRTHQGALVCDGWPGPLQRAPVPPDTFLAADDIGDGARVGGLIVFSFACYGAGAPQDDELAPPGARQVAPAPFVARLPQRLLGHPAGGALAFVGHVDRAWGTSFMWEDSPQQVQVFKDALHHLLDGQPVGAALDWFNERYAELATVLAHELHEAEANAKYLPDTTLARLWTASVDARNYVLVGDPAVRLAVRAVAPAAQGGQAAALRPAAETGPEQHDDDLRLALAALEDARRRHAEAAAALDAAIARVVALTTARSR